MASLVSSKFKMDFTPIKMFLSIAAIYLAFMTSPASAATRTPLFEPSMGSLLTSDLKSCPVPYSTEYCRIEGVDSCKFESFWPQVLNKYSWQNSSERQMCPYSNTSNNQNSES